MIDTRSRCNYRLTPSPAERQRPLRANPMGTLAHTSFEFAHAPAEVRG
jgi:hypothetical protein